MTDIVICADDFGMHPEVDQAIVDLARQQRLSATSVLVDGHDVQRRADWLAGLHIDVGLHLNLTEIVGDLQPKDVDPRLSHLIVACYARTVSRAWIRAAVMRQLDRYESIFGAAPAYIDGHQHVHQLPIVREILFDELLSRYNASATASDLPWIRSTQAVPGIARTGVRQWFKAQLIAALGANATRRLATRAGFQMNNGFAGVYDFTKPSQPYGDLLQCWLDSCVSGSLIMCHPSAQVLAGDPVGQARLDEYQVLSSTQMGHWLVARELNVVRLHQVVGSRSSLP